MYKWLTQARTSGEVGCTKFTNNSLSNTNHNFEWRYTKDTYVDAGADKVGSTKFLLIKMAAIKNGRTNSASDSGEVDSDSDGLIDLVEYLVAGSSLRRWH